MNIDEKRSSKSDKKAQKAGYFTFAIVSVRPGPGLFLNITMFFTKILAFFSGCILLLALTCAQAEDSLQKDQEILQLINHSNLFAFKLYNSLRQQPGNLLFSPYGVFSTLSLVYLGAAGETAEAIQKSLGVTEDLDLRAAVSRLNKVLSGFPQENNSYFRLIFANALWVQMNLPLLPEFLKQLSFEEQNRIRRVDFLGQPKAARDLINRWIQDRTFGRVQNLLPTDIKETVRCLLTSALYLKARWEKPFPMQETRILPFFPNAQRTVTMPMLGNIDTYLFSKNDEMSLLELASAPLKQTSLQLAMILVLPEKKEGLFELEENLQQEVLNSWLQRMNPQLVDVKVPKFSWSSSLLLKQSLEQLGLSSLFQAGADFSKMTNSSEFVIADMVDKCLLALEENGIDLPSTTGAAPPPKSNAVAVFQANHPFLFLVVEKSTGLILLMGRFQEI